MTDPDTSDVTEPSVSIDYFAGLFDTCSRIKLNPSKDAQNSINHRFRYFIRINVTQLDAHLGLIDNFLDNYGIQYRLARSGTSSRYIKIESRDSIETLYELLDGRLSNQAERFAFLVEAVLPAIADGKTQTPRGFLAAVKQFEELSPEWRTSDSRKYTTRYFSEYFEEVFDINPEEVKPLEMPSVDIVESPSVEYFAGLFDNGGRFKMQAAENRQYSLGYYLQINFQFHLRWVPQWFTGLIMEFLEEHDITYSDQSTYHHIDLYISRVDEIERFIEVIAPNLYLQYPKARFLYEQAIPAYRDEYHHTAQGFYELLKTFESLPTVVYESSRQYDATYFESEWNDMITPLDFGDAEQSPDNSSPVDTTNDETTPAAPAPLATFAAELGHGDWLVEAAMEYYDLAQRSDVGSRSDQLAAAVAIYLAGQVTNQPIHIDDLRATLSDPPTPTTLLQYIESVVVFTDIDVHPTINSEAYLDAFVQQLDVSEPVDVQARVALKDLGYERQPDPRLKAIDALLVGSHRAGKPILIEKAADLANMTVDELIEALITLGDSAKSVTNETLMTPAEFLEQLVKASGLSRSAGPAETVLSKAAETLPVAKYPKRFAASALRLTSSRKGTPVPYQQLLEEADILPTQIRTGRYLLEACVDPPDAE